jgi:hypothetical protein
VVRREHSSRCSLGRCLRLCLLHLVPGVATASIAGGIRLLSVHQIAVAACRYRCCIALFRALLVQVTALTQHTAASPDLAEFLAVITLCETSLSFVLLCPD